MFRRIDYSGSCWWCGGKADSREHRYKKSDLVRIYGPGPYRGETAPIRGLQGTVQDIRGPKSKLVKFPALLCQDCNNTRSQPFDKAYDKFIGYLHGSQEDILRNRQLDLARAFGADWREATQDFLRYMVKHIACRVAESGVEVSRPLRYFLDYASPLSMLQITFEIRLDIAAMMNKAEPGTWWLALGTVGCNLSRITGGVYEVFSHYDYGWLRLAWTYAPDIGTWTGPDFPMVALPTGYNVDPDSI